MPLSQHQKFNLMFEGQERPKPPAQSIMTPDIASQGLVQNRQTGSLPSEQSSKPLPSRTKLSSPPSHLIPSEPLEYDSLEEEDDYMSACAATAAKSTNVVHHGRPSAKRNSKVKKPTASPTYRAPFSDEATSKDDQNVQLIHPSSAVDLFGNPRVSVFCPLVLVAVYPYKFIPKSESDRVAKGFFDGGKVWRNDWEVSYIFPPPHLDGKPILLVPFSQVEALVERINKHHNTKLIIPLDPDLSFTIPFYDDQTPQPTFLGRAKDREHIQEMQETIGNPQQGYGQTPMDAGPGVDRSFAAFRKKMEVMVEATKRKNKALKKKRMVDRIGQQQEWSRSLKRAQRYLGLRPRVRPTELKLDPSLPWIDQQMMEQEAAMNSGRVFQALDVTRISQYPFESQPIIIAIDVESNERNHSQVTEVGVSTLDTFDLQSLPPGEGGRNWMAQIRSRHFRISETLHHVNRDFCPGDPTSFHFGKSEIVSLQHAGIVVDQCFQWPFSVDFKHDGNYATFSAVEKAEDDRRAGASPEVDNGDPLTALDTKIQALRKDSGTSNSADPVLTRCPTNEDQALANEEATAGIFGEPQEDADEITPDTGKDCQNGTVSASASVNKLMLQAKDAVHSKYQSEEAHSTFASQPSEEGEIEDNVGSGQNGPYKRPIILIGHDLQGDIQYLRFINSTIHFKRKAGPDGDPIHPTILESLDTAIMHRVLVRETQSRSLGHILVDLGLTGWNLHNAGNDARYTLEAFIGIAIKGRIEEDKRRSASKDDLEVAEKAREQKIQNGVEERRREAETHIRTEAAIWDAAAGQKSVASSNVEGPGRIPVDIGDAPPANDEESSDPAWVFELGPSYQPDDDDQDGGEPRSWDVGQEEPAPKKSAKKSAW